MNCAFRIISSVIVAVCLAAFSQSVQGAWQDGREVLDHSGISGGLIVHVGCGDGELTAELGEGEGFLVHGLDRDPEDVARARELIDSKGLYGRVSVDVWDGERLPYINNFANLILIEGYKSVPKEELLRVLCPDGVAIHRFGARTVRLEKDRPKQIDDWTHYMHDSSGNAVAHDTVIGPPRRMQWVGSPRYSRHHDTMTSMSATVSAGGKVFYIIDEAPPLSILTAPKWSLAARDAFNGTVLWKRDIGRWFTHLWRLKSGPAQLPRRLVADGQRVYVTLGYDAQLEALDAASGETVVEYAGTEGCEEVVLSDGVLFVQVNEKAPKGPAVADKELSMNFWDDGPRKVMAIDAASGRRLWSRETVVMPGTLAADSERVIFHDGESVVCLDRKGNELWRSEAFERGKNIASSYMLTLVIYEDVVLLNTGGTVRMPTADRKTSNDDAMIAFDAATGKKLWAADHPASGYKSPEDMLVVDGIVWSGDTMSSRAVGVFVGRDVRTGEVKQKFSPDVDTYWFHHRCHRGKATDNYLLMSRGGVEFVDVEAEHWDVNHWVRGACLYGVMPANGLLYAPQHPCACYLEAKMDGFNALAPALKGPRTGGNAKKADRLEKGPAYNKIVNSKSKIENQKAWPTYRGDWARSGRTAGSVPDKLSESWRAAVGGRLSSLVAAEGMVFVASIDRHRVFALDGDSGKELWSYSAGARVDSPPTIYKGLVLFGSADGYIYAVRASDGVLAWRFLAAPLDQRLTAFEQIESVWPVSGSVLVYDDTLYGVAGRSMFLDGGLRLWRLDPVTGAVKSETMLDENEPETGKKVQDFISWLNMPVALPDVLSCDGELIYMRSQPFRLDGTRLPLEAMARADGTEGDRGAPLPDQDRRFAHLFSPTGFLDDTNWHRTYWMYGSSFVSGWQGYYRSGRAAPAGKLLVVDDDRVYGFGRKPEYFKWITPIEHQLFSAYKKFPEVNMEGDKPANAIPSPMPEYVVEHDWTKKLPLYVRAMVVAGDTLIVAGPEDTVDENHAEQNITDPEVQKQVAIQARAHAGKSGAMLWAVSKDTGRKLGELTLDSPPVFDGLIAANGKLYMATVDGKVICFGAN